MSEPLYERYKEALRRGHVAALRGRLDAALVAYGEAAELAPERALPHASLGSVLYRLGRLEEALAAYANALERSPNDETALAGRAEVLRSLGRRRDAAEALDRLADAQAAEGRLAEAIATARAALELAESRPRRRLLERLEELAAEAGGTPDEASAPPDGLALVAESEALLDAGDRGGARDRLLAAAEAHRSAGHADAALDACYLGLAIAPDDPDLHLALARLYLDRGWRSLAADKLVLLARLVELTGDGGARERLCAMVGEGLTDDDRLAAICA